jgi:hypothetical protein
MPEQRRQKIPLQKPHREGSRHNADAVSLRRLRPPIFPAQVDGAIGPNETTLDSYVASD